MRAALIPFVIALSAIDGVPAPLRYDGGAFSLTLGLDRKEWFVQTYPEANYACIIRGPGLGAGGGTRFASYIFVDRMPESVDLTQGPEKWFAEYLKSTSGFLRSKVFDGPRSFRSARDNPVMISGKKLLRFDMVRRLLTRPAASELVEEEAVIYFLILPEFEKHRTFFVFTGRQIWSRDLGHRPELARVEEFIRGFSLSPGKVANQSPEPTPGSVTPRAPVPKSEPNIVIRP